MIRDKECYSNRQQETVWPVKYDEHPEIYMAWEVWTTPYRDSIYGVKVEEKPCGQLIITREKDFYNLNSEGRGSYFNEGYKYFFVGWKNGIWQEKTNRGFSDLMSDFEYAKVQGSRVYDLYFAYSALQFAKYPERKNYHTYSEYLRSIYPDYTNEDCAVFVLWNNEGMPLVQMRYKKGEHGEKWDMVYPGEQSYTPVSHFYWYDLVDFGKRFGNVEQVHPQSWFGDPVVPKKAPKQYMRIGTSFIPVNLPRTLENVQREERRNRRSQLNQHPG